MNESPAPLAPSGELAVRCASRVAAAGRPFDFDILVAASPSGDAGAPRLLFPGFSPAGPPERLPAGGWRFRGALPGPGFFALEARAEVAGRTLRGRDYFIVPETPPVAAPDEAGYYVFLGCGDIPIINGRETHALAGWTLDRWKALVGWMGANGMNRLWTLVNGYTLAYPSDRYPELRDRHARNASENLLGGLIRHAHDHGVEVHLMLTTDGHARGFCRAHPEAARLDAQGRPCPQFGLALEHPLARRYILGVLDEVLSLYPEADGVAVHPTESDPDRFNPESVAAYRDETGRDLGGEPAPVRRAWHNRAFARFMVDFRDVCRRHKPSLGLVMANCPWQDDHVAVNRELLPAGTRVAVWHYAWEDTQARDWPIHRWVREFGPGRVIYMPTSQSYLYPAEPERVMDRHIGTDRLVSTAAALGVRDTMYFAGWDIPPGEARLCDALLARRPTATLAANPGPGLIPRLYSDYLGLREDLLRLPRNP